eukprot:g36111.t1
MADDEEDLPEFPPPDDPVESKQTEPIAPVTARWRCVSCGHRRNRPDRLACSACGLERPVAADSDASSGSEEGLWRVPFEVTKLLGVTVPVPKPMDPKLAGACASCEEKLSVFSRKLNCCFCGWLFCPRCVGKFEIPEQYKQRGSKKGGYVCYGCEIARRLDDTSYEAKEGEEEVDRASRAAMQVGVWTCGTCGEDNADCFSSNVCAVCATLRAPSLSLAVSPHTLFRALDGPRDSRPDSSDTRSSLGEAIDMISPRSRSGSPSASPRSSSSSSSSSSSLTTAPPQSAVRSSSASSASPSSSSSSSPSPSSSSSSSPTMALPHAGVRSSLSTTLPPPRPPLPRPRSTPSMPRISWAPPPWVAKEVAKEREGASNSNNNNPLLPRSGSSSSSSSFSSSSPSPPSPSSATAATYSPHAATSSQHTSLGPSTPSWLNREQLKQLEQQLGLSFAVPGEPPSPNERLKQLYQRDADQNQNNISPSSPGRKWGAGLSFLSIGNSSPHNKDEDDRQAAHTHRQGRSWTNVSSLLPNETPSQTTLTIPSENVSASPPSKEKHRRGFSLGGMDLTRLSPRGRLETLEGVPGESAQPQFDKSARGRGAGERANAKPASMPARHRRVFSQGDEVSRRRIFSQGEEGLQNLVERKWVHRRGISLGNTQGDGNRTQDAGGRGSANNITGTKHRRIRSLGLGMFLSDTASALSLSPRQGGVAQALLPAYTRPDFSNVVVYIPRWDPAHRYRQCRKCGSRSSKGHNCHGCGHLYCSNCTVPCYNLPPLFKNKVLPGRERLCGRCKTLQRCKANWLPVPDPRTNTGQRNSLVKYGEDQEDADVAALFPESLQLDVRLLMRRVKTDSCADCGVVFGGIFTRRYQCQHCSLMRCQPCFALHKAIVSRKGFTTHMQVPRGAVLFTSMLSGGPLSPLREVLEPTPVSTAPPTPASLAPPASRHWLVPGTASPPMIIVTTPNSAMAQAGKNDGAWDRALAAHSHGPLGQHADQLAGVAPAPPAAAGEGKRREDSLEKRMQRKKVSSRLGLSPPSSGESSGSGNTPTSVNRTLGLGLGLGLGQGGESRGSGGTPMPANRTLGLGPGQSGESGGSGGTPMPSNRTIGLGLGLGLGESSWSGGSDPTLPNRTLSSGSGGTPPSPHRTPPLAAANMQLAQNGGLALSLAPLEAGGAAAAETTIANGLAGNAATGHSALSAAATGSNRPGANGLGGTWGPAGSSMAIGTIGSWPPGLLEKELEWAAAAERSMGLEDDDVDSQQQEHSAQHPASRQHTEQHKDKDGTLRIEELSGQALGEALERAMQRADRARGAAIEARRIAEEEERALREARAATERARKAYMALVLHREAEEEQLTLLSNQEELVKSPPKAPELGRPASGPLEDGEDDGDMSLAKPSGFALPSLDLSANAMQNKAAPSVPLTPGTDPSSPLHVYDVVCRLGEGTFGAVYQARHKRTGDLVALKVVELKNDDDLEMELKEARFMEECNHPCVLRAFGTWHYQQKLWLAFELCEAGSLKDIMEVADVTLTEPQVAQVVREVLKGLVYLHSNRRIHRDLKAANILLTKEGEVKLADFGVSCQLATHETRRRTVVGTPFWMAPELLSQDQRGYDYKADVWALGIVAMELAKGAPPLGHMHPFKALLSIAKNGPPVLPDPENWSSEFVHFIASCLEKDDAKRPTAELLLSHPFVKSRVDDVNTQENVLLSFVNMHLQELQEFRSQEAEDTRTRLRQRMLANGQGSVYNGQQLVTISSWAGGAPSEDTSTDSDMFDTGGTQGSWMGSMSGSMSQQKKDNLPMEWFNPGDTQQFSDDLAWGDTLGVET